MKFFEKAIKEFTMSIPIKPKVLKAILIDSKGFRHEFDVPNPPPPTWSIPLYSPVYTYTAEIPIEDILYKLDFKLDRIEGYTVYYEEK